MISTSIRLAGLILIFFSCRESEKYADQKNNYQRPNIIYIYADDLGYGELGSYGQTKIKTPYLDRLAKEGIRFTQHYTSTPVCAPARCMFLTGQHGGHSFIRGNYEFGGFADEDEGGQMPLPSQTFTIGHMLQQSGYTTGAIGKWGLGFVNSTGEPNKQGFDYFYGYLDQKQAHNYYPTHFWENNQWDTLENDYFNPHQRLEKYPDDPQIYDRFTGNEYGPDLMTEKALDFIRKNKEKPFFLYLPYTIPHVSLQVPDNNYYRKYQNQWDTIPYLGQKRYTPHPKPLAAYAGMISTLDGYVGLIMQRIKDLSLDENTIIMFSSDNGPTFNGGVNAAFFNSTGGLRGLKMDLYEGGIRVPFIARWPGHIPAGEVSDHISVQYDMMATLADLLNVEAPENDGVSMLPTLLGKINEQEKHAYLYFEYPEKGGQLAIRMGKWKGIKRNLKENSRAAWELYNLEADLPETKNVINSHPELIKQFDEIVRKEHRQATIREWEFVNSAKGKSQL